MEKASSAINKVIYYITLFISYSMALSSLGSGSG